MCACKCACKCVSVCVYKREEFKLESPDEKLGRTRMDWALK